MADWQKWNDPHYVYIAYCGDEALYVGCTWNPAQRLYTHSRSPWLEQATSIDLFGPFVKSEALQLECDAIWNLQPVHNKKGKARARATLEWADAAWDAMNSDAEAVNP